MLVKYELNSAEDRYQLGTGDLVLENNLKIIVGSVQTNVMRLSTSSVI